MAVDVAELEQEGVMGYDRGVEGGSMTEFFKGIVGKKSDFASKVLDRYSSKKAVGSFARELFKSESAESINERFAEAKRVASR